MSSRFCSIVAAFNLVIFLNSDFLIIAWYLKAAMYILLKVLDVSNTICGIHSLKVLNLKEKNGWVCSGGVHSFAKCVLKDFVYLACFFLSFAADEIYYYRK